MKTLFKKIMNWFLGVSEPKIAEIRPIAKPIEKVPQQQVNTLKEQIRHRQRKRGGKRVNRGNK